MFPNLVWLKETPRGMKHAVRIERLRLLFGLAGLSLLVSVTILLNVGSPPTMVTSPCNSASCEPRDVSMLTLSSGIPGPIGARGGDRDVATGEEILEKGLALAEASPVHLVVRATVDQGSTRCEWRGVARTDEQRELSIRFWLNLDSSQPLPSAADVELQLLDSLQQSNPAYPETMRSNFRDLARGGVSSEYLFLTCYIHYSISQYILGSGITGTSLTVAYDRRGEARSYELYVRAHAMGEFRDQTLWSEAEYEDYLRFQVITQEMLLSVSLEGRESILFLAPMGAHNTIAIEAWQVIEQWDLQTSDDDSVNAVRYGVFPGNTEHTQTLANLTTRITSAASSDPFSGNRISSPSGLNQEYRDIGALSPGDPLQLRVGSRRWELLDSNGTVVGQLASGFEPPTGLSCSFATVMAIATWDRERLEPEFQDGLRCDNWEVVVPELVFEPET